MHLVGCCKTINYTEKCNNKTIETNKFVYMVNERMNGQTNERTEISGLLCEHVEKRDKQSGESENVIKRERAREK